MPGILPTERLKALRSNPKILLIYGKPKVGKTGSVAELEKCLVLDTEAGAEHLEVLRMPIRSVTGPTLYDEEGNLTMISMNSFKEEMIKFAMAEMEKNGGRKPKPPYKYLVLDTIDKFEDYCIAEATRKYKLTPIGKNFEGGTVLELPNGGGYYYLREEVLYWIDQLASMCEHLILVSHIKDKLLDKGGVQTSQKEISLSGKLGGMVAAKADAIGYMYRNEKSDLWINFEAQEENNVMGARFPHLFGKKFPFAWDKIFLPDATPAETPAA